ncbi:MAG: RNA polymerase sigma factor [Pseudomonadota bacterium]|nr:RNA polymerase sigma factor [Pseudomonadota bacterium]
MSQAPDSPDLAPLRRQDHAAFEALVRNHHRPMLAVARAIVGDSLAEEVVQEAWVSVYRNLPGFEGRSSLKTWLFSIVSNQAKTRLRKEKRVIAFDDLSVPDTGVDYLDSGRFHAGNGHWKTPPPGWHLDSPDQLLEQSQLQHCIDHTLKVLPSQQRAVFLLRDIEQQELAAICNILEVTESYVRVLLHRARLKLMQVIDRYQETGEC